MTRRDGALKVTGRAIYAADNRPAGMVHAALATSGVARGRVASLDVAAARAHPGVIAVMTPDNRPPLARDPDVKAGPFSWRIEALQNAEVRYVGQPIALVMAETLEAATEGARLLAPRYDALPARIGFEGGVAYQPQAVGIGRPPATATGDMAAGRAAAARHVDSACETPMHYHDAMEPHAIVAHWEGDRLTLDTPSQALHLARDAFASYFGVPPGASGPRRSSWARRSSRRWRRGCWGARSSWCCGASRCSARSGTAARRARRSGCGWRGTAASPP
jgi:xanthine dehydrogenase YagR molybdenum-binding subunit